MTTSPACASKPPDSLSASASSSIRSPPIKIAVIGSGLTGLVSAYLLASDLKLLPGSSNHEERGNARIEIHIFERASKLGMDSKSISITADDNAQPQQPEQVSSLSSSISRWVNAQIWGSDPIESKVTPDMERKKGERRIDVPMRSFNVGYYTQTLALYRQLGIPIRKTNFTYSFAVFNAATGSSSPTPNHSYTVKSDLTTSKEVPRAPSPSVLYNGASGSRGFSLPSTLNPRQIISDLDLSSPLSFMKFCINTLPIYLVSLLSYSSNLAIITISYLYLLMLALYHHHLGHTLNPDHPISLQSISDFCVSHRIPRVFVEGLLLSLFSAVMTAQADSVKDAPAAEILAYIAATFGKDHCTVETGVEKVENALTEKLYLKGSNHGVHTSSKVIGILPGEIQGQVSLRVLKEQIDGVQESSTDDDESDSDNRQELRFDGFSHVILATQANQTSRFLDCYSNALRRQPSTPVATSTSIRNDAEVERLEAISRKLRSFKYETSVVTNHTDRSLLPPDEEDWRDLNLVSPTLDPRAAVSLAATSDLQSRTSSSLEIKTHFQASITQNSRSPKTPVEKQDSTSTPSSSEGSSLGWSYSTELTSDDEGPERERVNQPLENNGRALLAGEDKEMGAADLDEMIRKLDVISDPLRDGNHTMATHIIQRRIFPQYLKPHVKSDRGKRESDTIASADIRSLLGERRRSSASKLVEAHDGPLLMQTTNALPGLGPRAECVLSISKFDRVVLSRQGKIAQAGLFDLVKINQGSKGDGSSLLRSRSADWELRLGALQGRGTKGKESGVAMNPGIWVCGSWTPGIPLLEGCVKSARLVCEELIKSEGLGFESAPW